MHKTILFGSMWWSYHINIWNIDANVSVFSMPLRKYADSWKKPPEFYFRGNYVKTRAKRSTSSTFLLPLFTVFFWCRQGTKNRREKTAGLQETSFVWSILLCYAKWDSFFFSHKKLYIFPYFFTHVSQSSFIFTRISILSRNISSSRSSSSGRLPAEM